LSINFRLTSSRRTSCRLLLCSTLLFTHFLMAQNLSQALPAPHTDSPVQPTIPALLLSDIHFEPFADPGKVPALVAAPAGKWTAILAGPPSPDQEQRFAALQTTCHTRGVDTSYTLLESSLHAMQAHAAGAAFVTVSGDLISHAFSCKYNTLFPHPKPREYEAFVAKTLEFVIASLRTAFPNIPIYAALGNNDTACGDYQLDARSPFLTAVGATILQDLPPSQQKTALQTFALGGYYSALLPAPLEKTRLVVLNHLYMADKYSSCGGAPDPAEIDEQLGWARQEFALARQNHERVWIMGHIPPGVNAYSTAAKMRDICGGQSPVMFLSSDRLENLLLEYDDVIELGIFGHTHMDELRLVKPSARGDHPTSTKGVAIKMVPSISPVDGNNPAFTVARIASASSVLTDYEVYSASNQTGVDAEWRKEYDYAQTYHQTSFSAAAVAELITAFLADPAAKTQESQDYIRNFFVGDRSAELKFFWPQYACALSNLSPKDFASCACSTSH
jgi:sphingomyelin phosphodiesterase acid-like 3